MKQYISSLFSLFIAVTGYCQSNNNDTLQQFKIRQTNVKFIIGDSLVFYSLLVEPNGYFDFECTLDFSLEKYGVFGQRFVGKGRKKAVLPVKTIPFPDKAFELKSYFPNQQLRRTQESKYNFKSDWEPFYSDYDIKFSYIMDKLNLKPLFQSNSDSTIRIITPQSNHTNTYEIYECSLKKKQGKMLYLKIRHNYNSDFEILRKRSYVFKNKKQIATLTTLFKEPQQAESVKNVNVFCLLEIKTANTYLSKELPYISNEGRDYHYLPSAVRSIYLRTKKRK
jgi:hypothetical protein